MKIPLSSPLFLLLPALSRATDIDLSSGSGSSLSRGSYEIANNAAKGSLDVPVDGKDGRPHAGPWVETSAERDRKSSKDSDDIDLGSTKFDIKIPSSGHLSTEDGKVIPHSNGGVMDDPHRAGPKEGTRGTEGGVSEKGKESQFSSEKIPGSPKESPPLPHSDGTADDTGSLGMLEVRQLAVTGSMDF